ncbi:hypothetical protein EAL2_808p00800 (plasmid) [Peptoclostridium acidaminophilum DSM 3953]|uniref:Uncharacterized protein n=1 Tax=Peptoclostridium acidaminophilum DSM 3953 TaxID=1286171 RepID=W8TN23_PEPAC|nr:hypothetical protein EAL2_808p00800 [Peptoclostridium acidaminophilum DSM 3953]
MAYVNNYYNNLFIISNYLTIREAGKWLRAIKNLTGVRFLV